MDKHVTTVYVNGCCRNIPGTTRLEYTRCMEGSGFNYRGIPQEDYCDCYAEAWARFFGEHEGKIDENVKGYIRSRAREHCRKSLAHKDIGSGKVRFDKNNVGKTSERKFRTKSQWNRLNKNK